LHRTTSKCWCLLVVYIGRLCELNVNECESNPCLNGGTCVDDVASFRCVCPDGYYDKFCASKINECFSNPCQNNARCVDGFNRYITGDVVDGGGAVGGSLLQFLDKQLQIRPRILWVIKISILLSNSSKREIFSPKFSILIKKFQSSSGYCPLHLLMPRRH